MARTRIRISLGQEQEQEQAERIRRHAEQAGMDVSAYLVHAATRQMAETEAIEEQFSGLDALIAEAETEETAALPPELEPDVAAQKLTDQERRDVEAALNLVYGEDRTNPRPGQAT
jgi:diphthamide synthase (EF-2-diphthine--ammonia ligase)